MRQSFIVQAPAGSGKTELLTQRYLRLLATVDAPEQILAITFTRKAAAEMRERVLKAIAAAGRAAPETPHKRTTWELASAVREADARRDWRLLRASGAPAHPDHRCLELVACASPAGARRRGRGHRADGRPVAAV